MTLDSSVVSPLTVAGAKRRRSPRYSSGFRQGPWRRLWWVRERCSRDRRVGLCSDGYHRRRMSFSYPVGTLSPLPSRDHRKIYIVKNRL